MNHLLDTVTISELRRGRKVHPGVGKWQEGINEVWLSVVTLNELRYGMRKVEVRDPVFASHLATRNVAHFEATGIKLVNPWETVIE